MSQTGKTNSKGKKEVVTLIYFNTDHMIDNCVVKVKLLILFLETNNDSRVVSYTIIPIVIIMFMMFSQTNSTATISPLT